jgi:hypothetical protein
MAVCGGCCSCGDFKASRVPTPTVLNHLIHSPLNGKGGFEGDVTNLARGVARQSRLNAFAAAFAAGAALFQAIALIPEPGHPQPGRDLHELDGAPVDDRGTYRAPNTAN